MLEKFTSKSTVALKVQIAQSRDRLYRVALAWCGDPMLADDLVQETLASGISNHQQLRDHNRLFAWLYSILNNRWRSHIRAQRPEDELHENQPCDGTGPCIDCEQLELVTQVRSVVASLPLIERQVIVLVDLEEMTYCEVAVALDIPIGTVMSRLHRARQHLLLQMEKKTSKSNGHSARIHLVE